MKKKTIATSVLAIAMSASLAVGGTYALFTSESKVNVAINSGKVDVVATVANLQAYSGSWNTTTSEYDSVLSTTTYTGTNAAGYYFANGGFASVSTTANTVTLDRITPMDKVTFDVVLTNNSNVAIQYRTVIKVVEDDGLFSGLEVKIGTDAQVYGGTTTYSHWTSFDGVTKTVPVSIELPQGVGNEYQEKSCTISYTVEAVQGNAYVFDGEAWLISGETRREMSTLADALSAAQSGDTIKMARAGTYAPFTVATPGVTVEGVIGETKADSTVFVTTASENVKLAANDVTVKNAWFEISEAQTEATMPGFTHRGAIDMLVHAGSGTVANNITLDGCYFNGNNLADRAFIYCGNKLTVKNSTFEQFNYCAFDSMDDNNTPEKIVIEGNTFKGLNIAYDIYAGAPYTGSEKNLIINNNESDNGAIVRIWDYAQYKNSTGSAFNAQVMGNENISLYLTHFDNHTVTPIDTDATNVVYQMEVAFPAEVTGDYSVLNADGSAITTFGDHKTTSVHNGVIVYALRAGDYMLKNADHTYLFTVTTHIAGVLGSGYTAANVRESIAEGFCYNLLEGVYEVSSAAGLRAFAASVNGGNSYAGKTVKLMNDVDLAGIDWTPIGQSGKAFQGTFDGNDKTISNLKVNGGLSNSPDNNYHGLFGLTTSPAIIRNFTIENAEVSGSLYVGSAVGQAYTGSVSNVRVTGNVQVRGYWYVGGIFGNGYANVTDCSVNVGEGSLISGTGSYIGGIVGFHGEGACKIANCDSNVDIMGYSYVGGISGMLHYGNTIENCTVDNVTITKTVGDTTDLSDLYGIGAIAGISVDDASQATIKNCSGTATLVYYSGEIKNGGIIGNNRDGVAANNLVLSDNNVTVTTEFKG